MATAALDGGSASTAGELEAAEAGTAVPLAVNPLGSYKRQSELNLPGFKMDEAFLQAIRKKTPARSGKRQRGLLAFYQRQNELIDSLLETEALHRGDYSYDGAAEERFARRALHLSFAANVLLLLIRVAIAVISGSLSLIVATLDAVLDVVSSIIMLYTTWSARRRDPHRFPVGKARMEPLGIIVFSVVMGTAGFTIIVEGIKELVAHSTTELPHLWVVVGGAIGVVVMKLALFLYCRRSTFPAVQAFALDHLNDVLVNSLGLAGALLGAKVASWMDPAVAMTMALWVVWAWGGQAREHIMNLVGLSAPVELLQKLTYLAYHQDPAEVLHIDTVRAYTFGSTYIAEVDLVLPEDMPLRRAHDIGESLQIKLEQLPEIARAFVHLDYEFTHAPEHKHS